MTRAGAARLSPPVDALERLQAKDPDGAGLLWLLLEILATTDVRGRELESMLVSEASAKQPWSLDEAVEMGARIAAKLPSRRRAGRVS